MVKLPEIMERTRQQLVIFGVPEPSKIIDISMDVLPSRIAEKMLEVGGYLAYLEYLLGQHEASHLIAKDATEYALTIGLIGTDPKATIKAREADLISRNAELQRELGYKTQQAALVEQVKGLRNAYRAQYDVLSRVLAAKELEAEVSR